MEHFVVDSTNDLIKATYVIDQPKKKRKKERKKEIQEDI